MALLERELLPIHGTEVVLLHEVFKALETVRVSAGGVHRLEQRLKADVADELIVHFILEVVEVIVQQEVELPALAAELTALGHVFFCQRISHESRETCHGAAVAQGTPKERERKRFPANWPL